MRNEEETPLTERVLLVESHAHEGTLATIGQGLPRRSRNEVALFLAYNYAEVPVGRRFNCCFRHTDESDVAWVTTTVVAVTQQFGVAWDEIPHGWKTLALLMFEPEIPAMIRDLPEAFAWFEQPISVCISDKTTWVARTATRANQAR